MTDDGSPWPSKTREEMQNLDVATELLGLSLSRGQLFLLLGAGVSAGLGLPSWTELVERASVASGSSAVLASSSGTDLLSAMDEIRVQCSDDAEFLNVIHTALYQRFDKGRYPDEIADLPILRAIGAMVMSSSRGSSSEVLNLNFDDVLEWYLAIHGFTTQVLWDLPHLTRSSPDVSIYHLHGFLPLHRDARHLQGIVLSKMQYAKRIAENMDTPWNALLLSRLYSKVFLAIGTSMSDLDVSSLLLRAQTHVGVRRPLGFVLGIHTPATKAVLIEQGLVPLSVESYDKIPHILLDICRNAAGRNPDSYSDQVRSPDLPKFK